MKFSSYQYSYEEFFFNRVEVSPHNANEQFVSSFKYNIRSRLFHK
jgi:hypothetical protein